MAVALMTASVGLTGCTKDDGDVKPSQSDIAGTWQCVDAETRHVKAALTFDKGHSVTAYFNGAAFHCKVDREQDRMTLTGDMITIVTFTSWGNFLARTVRKGYTITFDYSRNGKSLTISNIIIKPAVHIPLQQQYELLYDGIHDGMAGIIN